jgi:hypothetical protein
MERFFFKKQISEAVPKLQLLEQLLASPEKTIFT